MGSTNGSGGVRAPTAVCVIRATLTPPDQVLIKVTTKLDIWSSAELQRYVPDAEAAGTLVTEFLLQWQSVQNR